MGGVVNDPGSLDQQAAGQFVMNHDGRDDGQPRIFTRQGTGYAVGYCGSGVVWAPWAGKKAALQVLDAEEGRSALDFRPPPAIPLYTGTPWFLPGVFAWLRLRDRLDRMVSGN